MSLNKFTSTIKNGLARKNSYRVVLSGRGPQLAGGFTDELAIMCESIEFPGQNLQSAADDLRNGPPREPVSAYNYASITASFICSSDMREKVWFEKWQSQILSQSSFEPGFYRDYVGDMRIYNLDRQDTSRYAIDMFEVYPKNIAAQDLGYATNDAYQTISVEFQYHRWEFVDDFTPGAGFGTTVIDMTDETWPVGTMSGIAERRGVVRSHPDHG